MYVVNLILIIEKMFNVVFWYSCWNCIRYVMLKIEKYVKYYFVMSFFFDVCFDVIDDIVG